MPFNPMSNAQSGIALLNQIRQMGAPGGPQPGMPAGGNPIDNGFIARMMAGNPGGLIGAILKRQNAPVNPGAPPPPGSPDYVEGGQGPMAGGPAPQMGMLARLFPQMQQQQQPAPLDLTPPAAPLGGVSGW